MKTAVNFLFLIVGIFIVYLPFPLEGVSRLTNVSQEQLHYACSTMWAMYIVFGILYILLLVQRGTILHYNPRESIWQKYNIAAEIVVGLAHWAKKYPRKKKYNNTQMQNIESELEVIEKSAIRWYKSNYNGEVTITHEQENTSSRPEPNGD